MSVPTPSYNIKEGTMKDIKYFTLGNSTNVSLSYTTTHFFLIDGKNCRRGNSSACRAFVQDVIAYDMWESNAPATINIKETTIGIQVGRDENLEDIYLLLTDFLNQVEKDFKLKKTVLYLDKKRQVFKTVGDAFWQKSTVALSLYTLLIRNARKYHKVGRNWKESLEAQNVESDMDVFLSSGLVELFSKHGIKKFINDSYDFNYKFGNLQSHDFGIAIFSYFFDRIKKGKSISPESLDHTFLPYYNRVILYLQAQYLNLNKKRVKISISMNKPAKVKKHVTVS